MTDKLTSRQGELLAEALGKCLVASGIVRQDAQLTGPHLLLFADDLERMLKDLNTRPAATVEGLETVAWRHPTLQWVSEHYKSVERHCFNRDPKPEPLVTRSQAEELLAAERAENDEAYELGKRDGYSEAVQEIDLKTGGDGEYRYCTDHDPERHTPDPETMIQRIVDRFETLNTMESISEIHEWKERAEKAKADNAAKDADNAALTARVNGFEGFLDDLAEILGCERDIGDVVNELDAINNRAEALETQLAAAKKALTDIQCIDWDGLSVSDVFDEINEIVERATLEAKP